MRVLNSKKGMMMEVIIATAVLVFGFIAIMALFNKGASKIEDKSAEKLCEASNSARRLAKLDVGITTITTPRACRTIDKELPEEGYPKTTDGVMANMRELMAKCWNMWLKGTDREIFGERGWFQEDTKTKCFICYTFPIKGLNDVNSFTSTSFDVSLDKTAYFAEDESDKCIGPGGGGYCMDECSGDFSRQFKADVKCKLKSKKCCRAENIRDSCTNKGGQCNAECPSGTIAYSNQDWGCSDSSKKCCVKRENYFTYRDYIQNYDGRGHILIENDLAFNPKEEVYAIAFGTDVEYSFWKATYFRTGQALFSEDEIIHEPSIIISKLNTVSDRCYIESGIAGE